MARGKQSALSARRQVESAHQVIDRLTSEVAEAKFRARQAEARAADADRLRQLLHEHNNDDLLTEALRTIEDWRQIARQDLDRRRAALRDVGRILDDLEVAKFLTTSVDRNEFAWKRYPALMKALTAGRELSDLYIDPNTPRSVRRLSDESVRRFQQLRGMRGVPQWDETADMADVAADILDAKQSGFTREQFREYFGLDDRASA
jgi:hypothetical protein